jgi:hypothetical protein
MIRAATPGVLIALTVGFFVRPLAVPLLIVAHALSSRVRYRRSHIHTLFVGAESIVAFLSGVTVYADYGHWEATLWWLSASGWAQTANLFLINFIVTTIGRAMLRGEPPEQR